MKSLRIFSGIANHSQQVSRWKIGFQMLNGTANYATMQVSDVFLAFRLGENMLKLCFFHM